MDELDAAIERALCERAALDARISSLVEQKMMTMSSNADAVLAMARSEFPDGVFKSCPLCGWIIVGRAEHSCSMQPMNYSEHIRPALVLQNERRIKEMRKLRRQR